MSLVDLIRALLILVTERLERDMTQMGSRVSPRFGKLRVSPVIFTGFLSSQLGLGLNNG